MNAANDPVSPTQPSPRAAGVGRILHGLVETGWWVTLVILAVFVVVQLVRPGIHFYRHPVATPEVRTPIDVPGVEEPHAYTRVRDAQITVPAVGGRAVGAAYVHLLGPGLLGLGMLYVYRKLLGDAVRGEVFTGRNVRRMRWLGILWMAWAVAQPLVEYWAGGVALSTVDLPGFAPRFDWQTLGEVFGGLLVLLLAEAFRIGTQLRRDAELTV